MKLEDCTYGTIVTNKAGLVGMVTGISENGVGEAIPKVSWQNGELMPYHHRNLEPYTSPQEYEND